MIGSPGTGKSMLAQRLPTILPPRTPAESLETTRIYSAMGRLNPDEALLTRRPFRTPHHTISDAGMVGGGSTPARARSPSPTTAEKAVSVRFLFANRTSRR
jgi:magnesium chelatase family protein